MRRFETTSERRRAVATQDETLVTREGPVMTLTFNRPEARNAMTWGMYDRLYQVCDEVDADDSVRVLVLRGAGGKAFVAGTEPVIAQIEGFAVGGGFRIATACDLRIATPDARFGAPIARTLGNCLSMAAYASLVDVFGPSRLKELIFTARLLTAAEAHAAGYVHEIVPADQIAARVTALAHQLAEHAPITLRVTKESIRRLAASRALPDDEDLVATTYMSADFREGVRAFLEKRKPRWSGR
jgi:enoyl-CoA hydratase/carnithine racemase